MILWRENQWGNKLMAPLRIGFSEKGIHGGYQKTPKIYQYDNEKTIVRFKFVAWEEIDILHAYVFNKKRDEKLNILLSTTSDINIKLKDGTLIPIPYVDEGLVCEIIKQFEEYRMKGIDYKPSKLSTLNFEKFRLFHYNYISNIYETDFEDKFKTYFFSISTRFFGRIAAKQIIKKVQKDLMSTAIAFERKTGAKVIPEKLRHLIPEHTKEYGLDIKKKEAYMKFDPKDTISKSGKSVEIYLL